MDQHANRLHTSDDAGNQVNTEVLSAIVKASERYTIVASQDIVDVRGLKLWAKGHPVSTALQQRLLDRKLQQPLEACLAAQNGVTLFSLHDDLQAFLTQDTALSSALRPYGPQLLQQLTQLPLHAVAQLLLTTAMATRPETLPHAVAAMALAGAMASGGSHVDMRLAMLGGLLHDIGEVYIQPQYLNFPGPLDLLSHKHLVVHPRVAQMLLESTTDYPAELCRAIGEHHERLDGSGYPARLRDDAISPLGRLLAVVEVSLGILRTPGTPLARADFALRVVPGEFDPTWTSFIWNITRNAEEVWPEAPVTQAQSGETPLQRIDQQTVLAQQLASALSAQGRTGPILDIVDTAVLRLNRLHIAWNSLGFWGDPQGELTAQQRFELEQAAHELQLRLSQLQRECLLLGERLGELEKIWVEPLWRGVLLDNTPAPG